MHAASCMDLARRRERPRRDLKLLDLRHELRGWEWSGIGHRGSPLQPLNEDPGGICEEAVGARRAVPVPTPARPGSGSKGCRASGGLSAPCRGTPWMRQLSAECGPAVKAPSAEPHFGQTAEGGSAFRGTRMSGLNGSTPLGPTPHASICRESTGINFCSTITRTSNLIALIFNNIM